MTALQIVALIVMGLLMLLLYGFAYYQGRVEGEERVMALMVFIFEHVGMSVTEDEYEDDDGNTVNEIKVEK